MGSDYGIFACKKCGWEAYCDGEVPTHVCHKQERERPVMETTVESQRHGHFGQKEYTDAQRALNELSAQRLEQIGEHKRLSSASNRQVDGAHYVKYGDLQPWDVWLPWKLNPFQAYALKYIVRLYDKGDPVVNVDKAIHTLEKLREIIVAERQKQ